MWGTAHRRKTGFKKPPRYLTLSQRAMPASREGVNPLVARGFFDSQNKKVRPGPNDPASLFLLIDIGLLTT